MDQSFYQGLSTYLDHFNVKKVFKISIVTFEETPARHKYFLPLCPLPFKELSTYLISTFKITCGAKEMLEWLHR